uniref:Uncharacterized protein n=1 Tax=viral metagenome TaxID=1070528 RepID=A0A6C0EU13_9ZZZZ
MNTALYERMELFILNEVDYAVNNGYSRRARRFMRRNLQKELNKFNYLIVQDEQNNGLKSDDYDPYDLSIKINKHLYMCLSAVYISSLFVFYIWISKNLFDFITTNNQTYSYEQTYSVVTYVNNTNEFEF